MMKIDSITGLDASSVLQHVSLAMLKRSLDFQQQAALSMLQALPAIEDPSLGTVIDTYA